MSEIDTAAEYKAAFYRLVGTTSSDAALVEQGESVDDVAYIYLTRGMYSAQRYLIDCGMAFRWRVRSSALSWGGAEATDGGRYASLPVNFLRMSGNRDRSSLVEADGTPWGREIDHTEDQSSTGDLYYLKNGQLWLARSAQPPSTLYLDYHYRHPAMSSGVTLDFPPEAAPLVVAEAADAAKTDGWHAYPDRIPVIEAALRKAREEARQIARRSRSAPRMRAPARYGTHW